ncbi:MAG: hypothetical protein AB7N80_10110 [Bdellovibrionales bacterium]
MKNIKWLFLIGLLTFAVPALAIRVVFNGGGYAEMVVLSAYSHMNTLLKIYSSQIAQGDWSQGEKSIVQFAAGADFSRLEVGFFYDESGKQDKFQYDKTNPMQIHISSRVLYDEKGIALSASELWALAFEAWGRSPHIKQILNDHGASRADVWALAARLAHAVAQKTQYQTLQLNGTEAWVHLLGMSLEPRITEYKLLLEWPEGTLDETPSVEQNLVCEGAEKGLIRQISSLQVAEHAVVAKVQWDCGSSRFEGLLMIGVPEGTTFANAKEQIMTHIHSIRPVNFRPYGPCDEALKE